MKKNLIIVMVLIMLVSLFTACTASSQTSEEANQNQEGINNQSAEEATTEEGETTVKQYVIGVSMDTQNSSYWKAMVTSLDNTAAELGNVELRYLVAEGDVNVQNQQIESLISQSVDAIICVPKDSVAVLSAVKKCNEANIPFLFCDRTIESTDDARVDYGVATDNYAMTREGALWLVDYAKENKIVFKAVELMGALTDPNAVLRSEAYNDVAEANADVFTIVQSIPTDWAPDKAYAGIKNAFEANPDINLIVAASDYFWPSASNALKEIGKYAVTGEENHVFFMGVDGEPYGVKAIEDGYIDGDNCQPIMESARQTLLAAIILADGGEMEEEFVLLPGFVLTQENFEELGPLAYGYADKDNEE